MLDALGRVAERVLGSQARLPPDEPPAPDVDGRHQAEVDPNALAEIKLEMERKDGRGTPR